MGTEEASPPEHVSQKEENTNRRLSYKPTQAAPAFHRSEKAANENQLERN